jgi:hypothetical protein
MLAEFTAAVSSSAFLVVVFCFELFLMNNAVVFYGVVAFLQVYTSDLTQLFTWTCERCGDLTEVLSSYMYFCLNNVYNFPKFVTPPRTLLHVPDCPFLGGALAQQ